MMFYATDAHVAQLERALSAASGAERLALLVELAWHLRQRDARRCERMAREADAILEARGDERPADADKMQARIALTLAECALLLSRTEEAEASCARARGLFVALADHCGVGDTALLESRVAEVGGLRERELASYREALEAYRAAEDPQRVAHARLWAVLASGFGDPAAVASELEAIRAEAHPISPSVQAHAHFIEGVLAFQRNAFLEVVPIFNLVVPEAEACGMLEQAFRAQAGLVSAHSNLGDREASCAVAERLLDRARALGWPRAIGHALANFGRQLSDTGQPERAVELLLEARAALREHPRARGFAIATYYLGDAYLALGRNAEALENLRHAEVLMRDLGSQPEVACLQAIGAQALSRLGRPDEALACAQAALDLARRTKSRLWEVEALRSLAEIHTSHGARLGEAGNAGVALRFLDQALGVVEAIGGHHEKSQLYTEIAQAHEAAGDAASALAAERKARAEEVKEKERRAVNQLMLAQERHETERAREQARGLAATLETLEQLRQVGQDITAHLDAAGMLQALDRHLARLADTSFIGVFVFDPEGKSLRRHVIERGRVLAESDVPLADLESYAARAARERREIHVDDPQGGRIGLRVPGTDATRTLWFAPLLVQDELLGVLTVQTPTPNAYGEREKLIFRTVCSYAAVALANARTHGELEAKHRRLVGTEAEMRLLATTDSLTGLANRRQFLAAAESEVARAARYGGAIGLVMADLDRFKKTNDAMGHGAGDRVLCAIADVLREQQRPHDVIGRLGGDEFAFVLPGADLEATQRVAERVRAAVSALRVQWHGEELAATLSLGCTSAPEAGPLSEDCGAELARLMRTADAALYEAKRRGRNLSVPAAIARASAN
jgi:diguanylate cyclase (GGDEF)-like protein